MFDSGGIFPEVRGHEVSSLTIQVFNREECFETASNVLFDALLGFVYPECLCGHTLQISVACVPFFIHALVLTWKKK